MAEFLNGLFFSLGGIYGFVLAFLAITALLLADREEDYIGSILATAGSVFIVAGAIWFWQVGPVWEWIKAHPYLTIGAVPVWATVGLVWSYFKWIIRSSEDSESIKDLRERFISYDRSRETTLRTDQNVKKEYRKFLKDHGIKLIETEDGTVVLEPPERAVVFWASYWPASALSTLLRNGLYRLARWFYRTFLVNLFKNASAKSMEKWQSDLR